MSEIQADRGNPTPVDVRASFASDIPRTCMTESSRTPRAAVRLPRAANPVRLLLAIAVACRDAEQSLVR